MSNEIDQHYLDTLESLIEVECETCKKIILVVNWQESGHECQNCYITKLEYLKLEKEKSDKRGK